jgi:hypothetical protein
VILIRRLVGRRAAEQAAIILANLDQVAEDLAAGAMVVWTPTGFVDTTLSGTMVYEERTGSGTGTQEVHP